MRKLSAAISFIWLFVADHSMAASMYHSAPYLPAEASGNTEVEMSDKVYREIWGSNPVKEFRLLPMQGSVPEDKKPHSGHWYPTTRQALNTTDVLIKYDKAFHNASQTNDYRAYSWERLHRNSPVEWHGLCNGYAASSLRHREPLYDVNVKTLSGEEILFTRKDIKGLLTGLYMGVRYRFLGGVRCEDDPKKPLPPERRSACDDINPGLFHVVLANWIGLRNQAIIFDRNADEQVWNFPLYSFSSVAQPIKPAEAMKAIGEPALVYLKNSDAHKLLLVTTTITYADAVNEEEILEATVDGNEIYKYIIELDESGHIIGGEWAFESITEHPDFLWVPLRPLYRGPDRANANPYLDIDTILQIWANSRGLDSPEDEPSPYDLLDNVSGWGDFLFYRIKTQTLPSEFTFLPATLEVMFTQTLGFTRGRDLLTIVRDRKVLAKPYVVDGKSITVPLPDGEPGITRYEFKWNLPYLPKEEKSKVFYTYSMD